MRRNRKLLTQEQIEIRKALAAYWNNSASASVMRDYASGNVVTVNCDEKKARQARRREQGLSGSSAGAKNFPGR